jgi:hypothetical protein
VRFGCSKDHGPASSSWCVDPDRVRRRAAPTAYRLADGNTSDDPAHIPTWGQLAAVSGRRDFLHVA